jgi:hypothetical protein
MPGSFAVRQSIRILARSVKRERAATANDPFVIEHSNEALVEKETTAHSAKTHEWVKLGPNHFGDCTKVAMVLWRYLTSLEPTAAESRIYHLHKKAANT